MQTAGSSGRRRSGHRRRKEPPSPTPAASEARDWAALSQDVLLAVFLKLGSSEIMQGPELVCTTWRRDTVDEPLLWRCVDMGRVSISSAGGRAAARAAVDRSAGQCEAFSGSCDDDLLHYLVERAPSLKSLHLSSFEGSNEVLDVVLKRLPLLEDLEISPSYASSDTENLFQSVCQACPLLRKLRMRFRTVPVDNEYYYGEELIGVKINGEVTTMCELCSLELLNCELTDEGLRAILDHSPVLESLYITGCFDGEMDTELRAKCARVKNLTVPDGSTDGYYDDYEWAIDDDFDNIHYCHPENPRYESLEMPFYPHDTLNYLWSMHFHDDSPSP